MTEAIQRARIAAMCGAINGVQTAFTNIPRELQDAQLPAFVVFPGPATYDRDTLGESMLLIVREYNLILYVNNAQFGTEGQTQIEVDPFFDAVWTYFAARPGLELDSEGPTGQSVSEYIAILLSDGGLQVGPYPIGGGGATPPKDYIQIRWRLQVKEAVPVQYAD